VTVSVEKAFTRTTEEADHLIALAKEKGKILTVFQNRRWDNDFLTLRHLISKDALGSIKELEIHYDVDFPFWMRGMNKKEYSPGDGMTFGLGSHTFDQALLLFGRPASVTGFLRVLRGVESETEDTFTALLQYEGEQKDLLVTVKTNIVSPMKDQLKYVARGTKGSYVKVCSSPFARCRSACWSDTQPLISNPFPFLSLIALTDLTAHQQHGTCIQEAQAMQNPPMKATDPSFGHEPTYLHGLLTTKGDQPFDEAHQTRVPDSSLWEGRYPTVPGHWLGFYETLRDAIRGDAELAVKPEQSRDGIRLIELVRESSLAGKTVQWH
jgi:predicted dehydrogenase